MKKNSIEEFKKAYAELVKFFTFQFPYWATMLLIAAAFSEKVTYLKGFLVFLLVSVVSFQNDVAALLPKWILYPVRFILIAAMLAFLLYDHILKYM